MSRRADSVVGASGLVADAPAGSARDRGGRARAVLGAGAVGM